VAKKKGKPTPKGTGAVPRPAARKTSAARTKAPPRTPVKSVKKPTKKPPVKPAVPASALPPTPPLTPTPTPPAADPERDRKARQSRERSKSVREIGPLPPVRDPARKERGRRSLKAFQRTYFPRRFRLAFSSSHHTAIDRMESCTDHGGLFACAMPRGSGKTTLAECEAIRAVLKGKRRFVVILCATSALAKRRLKQIVRELENNDLLAEDFPEACFPIRCLNRIHNRARGQTLNGEPTRIEMTAEGIILPTVPGAACSGAVIQVASMEGAIRGLNVSAPDGEPLRPDMVLIDDAQTKESAKSLLQTADRESVIVDDVLGLAGPDVTIAAMMLCTVIYPNDLSDRFLSDELHPEWQGVRTKMLEAFPERMDLWDEYAEVRREGQRYRDRGKRANEFLRERWDDMHRGAVVSWPERKEKGELSGVQCAMNKYITNRRGTPSSAGVPARRDGRASSASSGAWSTPAGRARRCTTGAGSRSTTASCTRRRASAAPPRAAASGVEAAARRALRLALAADAERDRQGADGAVRPGRVEDVPVGAAHDARSAGPGACCSTAATGARTSCSPSTWPPSSRSR
jgi:hypothetical protein